MGLTYLVPRFAAGCCEKLAVISGLKGEGGHWGDTEGGPKQAGPKQASGLVVDWFSMRWVQNQIGSESRGFKIRCLWNFTGFGISVVAINLLVTSRPYNDAISFLTTFFQIAVAPLSVNQNRFFFILLQGD